MTRGPAHRLRRARSERQADAGRAAARSLIAAAGACGCCRFPTTRRRSAPKSARALRGERHYAPDVMQLLYVANRYEWKPTIERELRARHDPDLRPLSGVERRLRRGAGTRRGVAGDDPEIPAAAGPDVPARHRARGVGAAQERRPRQYERDLALLGRVRRAISAGREGRLGAPRAPIATVCWWRLMSGRLSKDMCRGYGVDLSTGCDAPTFRAESRNFHVVRPSSLSGSSR